jgi:SAM-dependent methyltransferase
MNPHPLAGWVIDLIEPGTVPSYGPADQTQPSQREYVVHDICSSRPFPFADSFFDFCICTHVLEDVRDPLRVCEEMVRVAKAGYIEVPSWESELTHNLEGRHHSGRSHHRWLIDMASDGLTFLFKPHFVSGYWKTRIPRRWWKDDPTKSVRGFMWSGPFRAVERHFYYSELRLEIEKRVRELDVYPEWMYSMWNILVGLRRAGERVTRKR